MTWIWKIQLSLQTVTTVNYRQHKSSVLTYISEVWCWIFHVQGRMFPKMSRKVNTTSNLISVIYSRSKGQCVEPVDPYLETLCMNTWERMEIISSLYSLKPIHIVAYSTTIRLRYWLQNQIPNFIQSIYSLHLRMGGLTARYDIVCKSN